MGPRGHERVGYIAAVIVAIARAAAASEETLLLLLRTAPGGGERAVGGEDILEGCCGHILRLMLLLMLMLLRGVGVLGTLWAEGWLVIVRGVAGGEEIQGLTSFSLSGQREGRPLIIRRSNSARSGAAGGANGVGVRGRRGGRPAASGSVLSLSVAVAATASRTEPQRRRLGAVLGGIGINISIGRVGGCC